MDCYSDLFPFAKRCILLLLYLLADRICLHLCHDLPSLYSEKYARAMMYFSAGAYAMQSDNKDLWYPEACVKRAEKLMKTDGIMEPGAEWSVITSGSKKCDILGNRCTYYISGSKERSELIVAFMGTKDNRQLKTECLLGLSSGVEYKNYGKVNKYFYKALMAIWNDLKAIIGDPKYKDYVVTFTGHSLGAALASLAAFLTVDIELRKSDQIWLYSLGQPRLSSSKFAAKYDELLAHRSFRIVNSDDIVPRVSPCVAKIMDTQFFKAIFNIGNKVESTIHNTNFLQASDKTKPPTQREEAKTNGKNKTSMTERLFGHVYNRPCDPKGTGFHHDTEVWYADSKMEGGFLICEENETNECSAGVQLKSSDINKYIDTHRHYFGHKSKCRNPPSRTRFRSCRTYLDFGHVPAVESNVKHPALKIMVPAFGIFGCAPDMKQEEELLPNDAVFPMHLSKALSETERKVKVEAAIAKMTKGCEVMKKVHKDTAKITEQELTAKKGMRARVRKVAAAMHLHKPANGATSKEAVNPKQGSKRERVMGKLGFRKQTNVPVTKT